MYSINLPWKSFNVDLASIEAFVKSIAPSSYKGNSADSDLSLWFSDDPTLVPMHDVTTSTDTQVPTLDEDGNPVLDEDGNPTTHTVTQTTTTSEPTGVPSVAAQIQTKWDSILSNSAEATAYATNATLAVISKQVEAAQAFCSALLIQFNTENIHMGISAGDQVDEVLTVMTPVLTALQSGSPTSAIKRAKAIPSASYDSTFVTAARLLQYVNKIETFLGLPLSTSLS